MARSLSAGLARTVGSANYWVWQRTYLMAMTEQLGSLPTLFVTHSAADYWCVGLLGLTAADSVQARIDAVAADP